MRPPGLCRSQNHEMRAGADETQPGRHILKVGIRCPIISTPKAWEGHGETTIQTTSKQYIGGATKRKDQ